MDAESPQNCLPQRIIVHISLKPLPPSLLRIGLLVTRADIVRINKTLLDHWGGRARAFPVGQNPRTRYLTYLLANYVNEPSQLELGHSETTVDSTVCGKSQEEEEVYRHSTAAFSSLDTHHRCLNQSCTGGTGEIDK
ncbi:hypothetical protein RvY_17545 [Ramazzottius varieornatus]|uniref:Uncharacterized protein n=1 Tax=Ramazzottius varieornatus TaxID=947166 RepID=A0A1D1W6B3_RAMVA|nr:hypothetical protein RvY_17545 [Ramazzottius varieornatus]